MRFFVFGQPFAVISSKRFYEFPYRKPLLLFSIPVFSIVTSAMLYFCGEALIGLLKTIDLVRLSSNILAISRIYWFALNWGLWTLSFYHHAMEHQFARFLKHVANTSLLVGLVSLVLTTFMLIPFMIKFGWGDFEFLLNSAEVYWNQLGILHAMLWTFGIYIYLWFGGR